MNNTFFSSLLCITVLALAPACTKKKTKPAPSSFDKATADKQKEIQATIELSDTVFEVEVENDLSDQKAIKF